ncbi:nuclear transport factor 2 family protein [Ilumatobacter sp.]|uniref:nuclear transport factor 2 family protein n=1 Tax=Ilumatobacter sp. TaxID=1967498 RepID=UPI003C60F2DE
MMSNRARADTLERVLRAALVGDRPTLETELADDVRVWTPTLSAQSLEEFLDELDERGSSFSDFELTVSPLDVGGLHACIEWTIEMTHTGRLRLPDATEIGPSGIRVVVHGTTVAEFLQDRICSVRQYWDEFDVLDQLPLDGSVED